MKWNWQLDDWPELRYDPVRLAPFETNFLIQGGVLTGVYKHLRPGDEAQVAADMLTGSAMSTSAIEGEMLDRDSVRSSILRHLGKPTPNRRTRPLEEGTAQLTVDLQRHENAELTHETLFGWHRMLLNGGAYRTHTEPMQIVSGPIGRSRVHFEAPPSEAVSFEISGFLHWFNSSRTTCPKLARAGMAHLRFESIHPFEDGNGRIGRAISEVALGQSRLSMLSTEIESRRSEYYAALELASQSNEVTDWLLWFAEAVIAAQKRSISWIEFTISKSRLLDNLRGKINERQEKVLLRMFEGGPDGFKGGLSARNYQCISGASPATAGRDLIELVNLNALTRIGQLKGTRYWLKY